MVRHHRQYKPNGLRAFTFFPEWREASCLASCVAAAQNDKKGMENVIFTVTFCIWNAGTISLYEPALLHTISSEEEAGWPVSQLLESCALGQQFSRASINMGIWAHCQSYLASPAKLPAFAGHRGSDCCKCLCNLGKAPELDTQAVVTALKSADIFLQTSHTTFFCYGRWC